jgi:S1-C subfamily serine protease
MGDGTEPSTAVLENDDELLDAYSRAVMGAVDRVMPTVVSLRVQQRRGPRAGSGQGSGVIIAPDGYVLTNSHVVHHAHQVIAVFVDGHQAEGRVVGDDPATDLALVRVHGDQLPHASLRAGSKPRPGQLAIAIGNPLGFDATVSTGVISALGRSLGGPRGQLIEDVIQHTAPLNPGNSGGPLVSSSGRVLGINSAMAGRSQGIGFAIPVETAVWVVGELLARGRVRRAFLGVSVQTMPLAGQRATKLAPGQRTCIGIVDVNSGTPADQAGLRAGDVLLAANGTLLQHASGLHRALRHVAPGQPITLRVLRDQLEQTIEIVPTEAPH